MRGLILKDLMNLKRHSRIYLVLIIFYFILGVLGGNKDMFNIMMVMGVAVMLPITALAYDERSKWDKYALTMPISRNKLVLSKYILTLILLVAAFIVCVLTSIFFTDTSFTEIVLVNLVTFSIGILMMSFILPIMFKFGVEKGRILMMIILFTPTAIIMLLSKVGVSNINEETLNMYINYLPIVAIVILILSVFISLSINRKKEF